MAIGELCNQSDVEVFDEKSMTEPIWEAVEFGTDQMVMALDVIAALERVRASGIEVTENDETRLYSEYDANFGLADKMAKNLGDILPQGKNYWFSFMLLSAMDEFER